MNLITDKFDTILLADPEPYYMWFILDFIESEKYQTLVVDTFQKAIEQLQQHRFRAILLDLSIPLPQPQSLFKDRNLLFEKYPGLLLATYALNHNYLGRQIVIYSRYDDPLVREFTDRLGITFSLKGRPRFFRDQIVEVLSYDPLATVS